MVSIDARRFSVFYFKAGKLLAVDSVNHFGDHVAARKWWLGELSRIANEQGVALDELAITPAHLARIEALVADGKLNDKLARQVIEGILAGEGDADAVVAKRNLVLVSDDGPLLAAIDEALAAAPDVAEKIKSGKLQAVDSEDCAHNRGTEREQDEHDAGDKRSHAGPIASEAQNRQLQGRAGDKTCLFGHC